MGRKWEGRKGEIIEEGLKPSQIKISGAATAVALLINFKLFQAWYSSCLCA